MNSRYIQLLIPGEDSDDDEDIIKGVLYEYQKVGKFNDVVMSISGGYYNLKEILDVSSGTFMRFMKH